jgi:hypothetical protein
MQDQVMFTMDIIKACHRFSHSGTVSGILFIALVLIGMMMACTKETDDRNPVVEIILPYENQVFAVGDSIRVQGTASDETGLKSIQVTITDLNFIVKDYVANVSVSSNPQHFDFWYTPSNMKLPDGDYYIQIRASDGVNTKYKYRLIRLSGSSPHLTNLVVITRNGDASFALNTLDPSSLGLVQRSNFQHTYAASDISWYAGQLYLLGRGFGECYVMDPGDYSLDFKLYQDGTPSLTYHENMLAGSDRFYIGLTEGYVKGYNKMGIQHFIAEMATGRKPRELAFHRQLFLVVAEEHNFDPGSWIAAYFLNSGDKWTEYRLPEGFEVVSVASLSNDEVIIAGNVNGTGRLLIWNISASAITTAWQATSGGIRDMAGIESGTYLLACDAEIMIFKVVQQSTSSFLSHPGAVRLRIDPATNTLFAGNPDAISAYNLTTKTLAWKKLLPDPMADFHLNYE